MTCGETKNYAVFFQSHETIVAHWKCLRLCQSRFHLRLNIRYPKSLDLEFL